MKKRIIWYSVFDETGPLWDGQLIVPPDKGDLILIEKREYEVLERIWCDAESTLGPNCYNTHGVFGCDLVYLCLKVRLNENKPMGSCVGT